MEIQTVGIAGLGLLGRGIAACFLAYGFNVIAFTRRPETHAQARRYISIAIQDLIARAGFSEQLGVEWRDRYREVTALAGLAVCDFVIESVVEDTAVKQDVFDQLEAIVPANIPIASNTSSLPVTLLQRGRRHPERFMGMHWAEPALATRFLELIRGEQTADAPFNAVAELAVRLGKEPSLVQKDVPAFIANRLAYAMYREAAYLLEMRVGDVETIDRSFRNSVGLWATICGPFRWIDMTGGPASYGKALEGVLPSLNSATELSPTFRDFIERDAGGTTKDGAKFYQYDEGEARRWDELLREHAWIVRDLMSRYFPQR
jgi:3-hydroxybutyryl-CoA dehydrogenase